ncbi:hypothetical protein BC940DRAFT_365642 [Gongronella butleri]|nr:hypothetical protein BC940DRAFT_365642 [Gongronella butleri]
MAISEQAPVIIIGANLAGLMLARALQVRKVPFEVYEQDAGLVAPAQGSSISLHQSWTHIDKVFPEHVDLMEFLMDAMAIRDNPMDVGMSVIDGRTNESLATLASTIDTQGLSVDEFMKKYPQQRAFRLNRFRIRQSLAKTIDVHWGHRYVRSEQDENGGGVTVFFENGVEVRGCVVVGADGAHSRVCNDIVDGQLSSLTQFHPGLFLVSTQWLSDAEYKELRTVCHHSLGHVHTMPRDKSLIENPKYPLTLLFISTADVDRENRPDTPYEVCWIMSRYCADAVNQLNPGDASNADRRDVAFKWANDALDGPLRTLVTNTPAEQKVYKINLPHRVPPRDYLEKQTARTVIGDAAHPMVPARGSGGNQGVMDAVVLALELEKVNQGTQTIKEALANYHAEMVPRATPVVEGSSQTNLDNYESVDHFINMMRAIQKRYTE